MTDDEIPDDLGEPEPAVDHVPDAVLDELMVAFSEPTDEGRGYDFDDPSLDRLLGLAPGQPGGAGSPDDDGGPTVGVPADDGPVAAGSTGQAAVADTADAAEAVADAEDEVAAVAAVEPPAPSPAPSPARRTIVITDDDQPDIAYLDEELEERFRGEADGDGTRSTVVIGDLDEGPPVEQIGDRTGHAIDPRMRARRIAVRREQGRRRLFWVGLGIGVVLVLVSAIAIVASPLFDVRTVDVQGAVYTDQDVLAEVVDAMMGDPVLLVDTQAAEDVLRGVPWVDDVRITTDFPHRVLIDIRERRPVASFQGSDQKYRVIDVEGRVLDVITGQPVDYLLITGDNPDTPRGGFAGAPYAASAHLVSVLPLELRAVAASVRIDTGTGTLSLVLDTGAAEPVVARLGDPTSLDDKLARLLQAVRNGLGAVCQVDVSTSEVGLVPC